MMKKFLKKVLILVVIVLMIVETLNEGYLYYLRKSNIKYQNMPEKIMVANTGSSHGYFGFSYSDTEYEEFSFNFAKESQSFVYDNELINFYLNNFDEGAVLFIPVSYFSFWNNEMERADYEDKMNTYYDTLDREHINFANTEQYLKSFFRIVFLPCEEEGCVFEEQQVRISSIMSREELGLKRAQYHLTECILDLDGEINSMNEESLEALESLIRLCQENGVRPILITTPVMSYYSDNIPQDVLDTMYSQIQYYVDTYQVEYWDYSSDERFKENEGLFIDTDHLNEEGATYFTQILLERAFG